MSGQDTRQRTNCSVCAERFQGRPTEVMYHGHVGGSGYWLWYSLALCPPCKAASHDFWHGQVKDAFGLWTTRGALKEAIAAAVATAPSS